MNDEFGIYIQAHRRKRFLNRLKPLIKHWNAAVVRYCEAYNGKDAPYNYNERSNISMLAAGAWTSGAIAFEEYTAQKINNPKLKRKGRASERTGRADLFLTLGKVKRFDVQVEGKHRWMRADMRPKTILNNVESRLAAATRDVRLYREAKIGLGCCFFPISFRVLKHPDFRQKSDQLIRDQIKLYKNLDADLWAWSFPRSTRQLKYTEENGDIRFWPGVILALRVA